MTYIESIYQTKRRKTGTVAVGKVHIGSEHPVRIQSMTTTDTRDAEKTADQCMRLRDAGCEFVRVTVQGIKEADSLEKLKNILLSKGYDIPIAADIHFYPAAGLRAADFVEKIRINPGNFADKRASFKTIEYTDESYADELERIEEKFFPLLDKCRRLNRAIRIGTNHGSLSDRIMNRFGDTPKGMVESAFEFARICRKYDFHNFLFSMKSSNPIVMIQAYRLLVKEMDILGWDYPLHLGVTEAGDGEDGRIKSAMGIGSLLLDGIGDTIRVSLTEDPWHEIDPCQRLKKLAETPMGVPPFQETYRSYFELNKRLEGQGKVWVRVSEEDLDSPTFFSDLGYGRKKYLPDYLLVEKENHPNLEKIARHGVKIVPPSSTFTLQDAKKFETNQKFSFVREKYTVVIQDEWEGLLDLHPETIVFSPKKHFLHKARAFFEYVKGMPVPVIFEYNNDLPAEDYIIAASSELGSLYCDGLGEGIMLSNLALEKRVSLAFNILQAARLRIIKTDFISCPSCGRTLFDLQDVTKRIKEETAHLAGLKIAIMGCIVNGPGEMADADFGYVGSKPGKIDLYVGKKCVEKDIDFSEGPKRLVELIKQNGRWIDP